MTLTLTLVRHGQTHFNQRQLLQGSCDSPLTRPGRDGVRITARHLADVPFQAAYASPSGRAVATAAQTVLTARVAHPGATLADLYDPDSMPTDLQDAHRVLDKAVDAAYVYRGGKDDAARVAFLFALYQKLTGLQAADQGSARRRKRATAPLSGAEDAGAPPRRTARTLR